MLVNVKLSSVHPYLVALTRGSNKTSVISPGMYLCGHWNFECEVKETLDHYPIFRGSELFPCGVCDYPLQLVEKFPELVSSERKFVISFVHLKKADEPKEGGWRWHKWGRYIGTQDPQCEYLADEPTVQEVYTYHVYEVLD